MVEPSINWLAYEIRKHDVSVEVTHLLKISLSVSTYTYTTEQLVCMEDQCCKPNR